MRRSAISMLGLVMTSGTIAANASAQVAFTDSKGRQWRQVVVTTTPSWLQVAAVCPTDGVTPCSGSLGTVSVDGWVWATRQDVIELFSEWIPTIAQTGAAGGAGYTLEGLSFFGYFTSTSFSCTTFGCAYGMGAWSSTLVPGSKTAAYAPAVGAGYNPNFASFTANAVAPVGELSYYRGVWLYLPAPVSPCPADLNDDGAVGPPDLAALLSGWGTSGPADLDGSGSVGAPDLAQLLAAWGDC